jgi:hypothetical protein
VSVNAVPIVSGLAGLRWATFEPRMVRLFERWLRIRNCNSPTAKVFHESGVAYASHTEQGERFPRGAMVVIAGPLSEIRTMPRRPESHFLCACVEVCGGWVNDSEMQTSLIPSVGDWQDRTVAGNRMLALSNDSFCGSHIDLPCGRE